MIIPCIDLMDGKVVQLVQGREKALEGGTPDEMLAQFAAFPEIQVIDLDAALGRGTNTKILTYIAKRCRARIGGGVRTAEHAETLARLGAARIIVGTAAFRADGPNFDFLAKLEPVRERVLIALDSKQGRIVIKGWQESLDLRADEVIRLLEPYCKGFLCTYVDKEGMMQGTDLDWFARLRQATSHEITAAGGITTVDDILALDRMGIHSALGMAIYTGRLDLTELAGLRLTA
jgi:phosphoribosylformimino-5-aminoimidazole carboxamide ribotide isomerase